MSAFRRSLMHVECEDSRRRSKHKRSQGKRRNTIAGTDVKELAATVWWALMLIITADYSLKSQLFAFFL